MKHWTLAAALAVAAASTAWAQAPAAAHAPTNAPAAQATTAPVPAAVVLDAHTRQDMERHLGMAKAHTLAAQCLAAGTAYEECQKQLQTACKGLALGKNCGMRHAH